MNFDQSKIEYVVNLGNFRGLWKRSCSYLKDYYKMQDYLDKMTSVSDQMNLFRMMLEMRFNCKVKTVDVGARRFPSEIVFSNFDNLETMFTAVGT